MSLNDLTADLLTRIRNAARNRAPTVNCLNNKLNQGVCQVLVDEGFLKAFEVIDDGRQGVLRVELKYGPRGEQILHTIDRVSKVGCRRYCKVDDLPRPLQGLGLAVISTSSGVLSDRICREKKVGGEIVAIVT